MVRLSKIATRRLVSKKRPKIKTGTLKKGSCCGCSCKPKVRKHSNAVTGELASAIFIPSIIR